MKKYVLGVDGGGTKTQCVLFDMEGNEVDTINWGPTNHEVLEDGFVTLKSELASMIDYLRKRNNLELEQIVRSVFGMAGVDTRSQNEVISKMLQELGFINFELCNDAYLGIKAGSITGWGIGVVHGTGLCVAGIDQELNKVQIGGQGMYTGDFGGGSYVGEKFIQAIYNYYFRCGEYTCMLDMLPEELKVSSKYDFIDHLRKKVDEGIVKVGDLNRIVFNAANTQDAVALRILEELGSSIAASINGCIKEMKFNKSVPLQIILSGSVNIKANNDTIIKTMKENVYSKNRDCCIEFRMLDKLPAIGAVIWAFEGLADRDRINKIFF